MGLSEKTTDKLRAESEELGGTIYEEDQKPSEEDVTRFEEDDDPLTHVGEFEDDETNEEAK